MDLLTLPPPECIRERIANCERELKALRRLLRVSQVVRDAEEARQSRADTTVKRTLAKEVSGAR
ncbi:MAG TPA: hypothetical protein VKA46_25210 [Gemmataceae bacterium]|nr:hypothetical protein [Gemmataceae bacterium]